MLTDSQLYLAIWLPNGVIIGSLLIWHFQLYKLRKEAHDAMLEVRREMTETRSLFRTL
jgi:hypothetical protein